MTDEFSPFFLLSPPPQLSFRTLVSFPSVPRPPLSPSFSPALGPLTPRPPSPRADPVMAENDVDNELLDYEDDEVETAAGGDGTEAPAKKDVKGSYVSIHSSGFRDFLLKPELLRAIVDCGFEHPSEGRQRPCEAS